MKPCRERYAVVPLSIYCDKEVGHAARSVYGVIAAHAGKEGKCFPSAQRIGELLGMSRTTVVGHLGTLRRRGYLTIEHRAHCSSALTLPQHPLLAVSDEPTPPVKEVSAPSTPTVGPINVEVSEPSTLPVEPPDTEHTKVTEHRRTESTNRDTAASPASARAPDPAVKEIFEYYKTRIQPQARERPDAQIGARLKTWSATELQLAIDHFAASPWMMAHNAHRGAAWFFANPTRIESYVHLDPTVEARYGAAASPHGGSLPATGGGRPPGRQRPGEQPLTDAERERIRAFCAPRELTDAERERLTRIQAELRSGAPAYAAPAPPGAARVGVSP